MQVVKGCAFRVIAAPKRLVKEGESPSTTPLVACPAVLAGRDRLCQTGSLVSVFVDPGAPSAARRRPFPSVRGRAIAVLVATAAALTPAVAFAHGAPTPAPGWDTILTGWEFDPLFIIPAALVVWAYLAGVRRVNRLHPRSRHPRARVVFFLLGMAAFAVALMSPIARYDTDLFAAHMVQHMLIIMVAAPLVLLGTPVTLALRGATPNLRRHVLLPALHSRVLKAVTFPVLAWGLLAGTLWLTHYSAMFDAALENDWLHRLEHLLYVVVAFLFWWPAVSAEPSPWRLGHPVRMLYVFLQMPQNSFLAVSIYGAERVIFPHYATVARTWGPSPLTDQSLAGIIMWVGGDAAFLVALAFIAYGWVQHEERQARRQDRALARRKAEAANAAAAAGPPPVP